MNHNNPNKKHVALEDTALALTDMRIAFDAELFVLLPIAGNRGVQYHLSPKHAKRISIVLAESVKDYEEKHGPLDTHVIGGRSDKLPATVTRGGLELESLK